MIRHNGIVIDRKESTIAHGPASWRPVRRPSQTFRALAMLILGNGVSIHRLFQHIYGSLEDGGPLEGPHIFHVRFAQWKPIFTKLHLGLDCVKVSGVALYSLTPLEAAPLEPPPTSAGRTHLGRLAAPVAF